MIIGRPINSYPAIESGYISGENGEYTTAGKVYASSPQVAQFRAAGNAPAVSVRVGRKQAVIGVGGFYAPKTTL